MRRESCSSVLSRSGAMQQSLVLRCCRSSYLLRGLLSNDCPAVHLLRRRMADKLVGPLDEVLHVWCVGMSTIVLAPGKLALEKTSVDRGHLRRTVITFDGEALCAEQSEHT